MPIGNHQQKLDKYDVKYSHDGNIYNNENEQPTPTLSMDEPYNIMLNERTQTQKKPYCGFIYIKNKNV